MKPIKKLHNIHKGEEVWLVGSGPSLDTYPADFLEDKIGITLHLASLKFPNSSYRHFNEYDRLEFCKKKDPELVNKITITACPFYRRTIEESKKLTEDLKKGYYFEHLPYPPNGRVEDMFTEVGQKAMTDMVTDARSGKVNRFGDSGTCAHAGLYMAILMGAKKIHMIGCEFKSGKKEHFGKAWKVDQKMRPEMGLFSNPDRTNRMFAGLEAIKRGAKKHGIEIIRYSEYGKKE